MVARFTFPLALLATALIATPASARQVTVDTSRGEILAGTLNQGAWNTAFPVPDTSPLTRVGFWFYPSPPPPTTPGLAEIRSFYTFDLRGLGLDPSKLVSASLHLRIGGMWSSSPSETVGFYEVTTPAAVVNTQGTLPPPALFADLGDGDEYAQLTRGPGDVFTMATVPLNTLALDDIGAVLNNGYFTIGTRLLSYSGDPVTGGEPFPPAAPVLQAEWGLQNGGAELFAAELVLEAIPEPATWLTMLVGFGAVGAMMRRRKVRVVHA